MIVMYSLQIIYHEKNLKFCHFKTEKLTFRMKKFQF